ncbi:hypothetical protein ACFU7Y_20085 [Kitasatospora sp. NPDC057542]|uniref:hypothetical protein n=1 Tax=Streptomycetaceae TaxID=2062 RepID=UPI001CCD14AE|nr:hypothetical protein [Streptomyces sp. LS1784]
MSFENRLGRLLKDEDPYASGPDPVPIIAAARRRRARRRAGTGAVVVAVALVCGATAVTAGNARRVGQVAGEAGAAMTPSAGALTAGSAPLTPTATPVYPTDRFPTPAPLPLSPVKRVAAGEKVELAPKIRVSVTPTESCQDTIDPTTGAYSGKACTNVPAAPDVPHDRPGIAMQFNDTSDSVIAYSYYVGPTPARIVVFVGGRPTLATLLTTPGMERWVGYYAALPPGDPQPGAMVPAVGAYDADGRLLAGSAGHTANGLKEQPPAVL